MNLLAKRAGLLLSAAVLIFLISCEDDSFLLGFRGKKKFEGNYHEIVFDGDKSSVLLIDSVFTDQSILSAAPVSSSTYRFLLGQYDDPELGIVRAEVFTQFAPDNTPNFLPYFNPDNVPLTLDSVVISLRFDYYLFGYLGDIEQRVSVHRLIDDSLSHRMSGKRYTGKRYTTTSTTPYDPTPLGEMTFNLERIIYDFADDAGRDSSFYLKATLGTAEDELTNPPGWAFGKELFAYAGSKDSTALVGEKNLKLFREKFYGLAFIPANESKGILGYNPLHTRSTLALYYHSQTDTSILYFDFMPYDYVGANAFTNITTTRIGELASLTIPQVPFYPNDNKRYIQDGSTVITELDLSDFYSFADTLEDVIINSAELSLDVYDSPAGINPPANLFAVLMKEEAGKILPLDRGLDSDKIKMAAFESAVYTDTTSYAISNELTNQSPLVLAYNKNSKKYNGFATLFFQKLFDNKDKPELNIEHVGFYPATAPVNRNVGRPDGVGVPAVETGIGNEVNRAILKTSGIKLKLYYTKTNLP